MDEVKQALEWLTGHGFGLTDAIGILSIIAALTPTPIDNAILIAVKKAINLGGANWLNAENKRKPGEKPE